MLQQIDGLVPKYSHMPMPSANETDKCIGIEAIRTFFLAQRIRCYKFGWKSGKVCFGASQHLAIQDYTALPSRLGF
jgi:hypothetical protein